MLKNMAEVKLVFVLYDIVTLCRANTNVIKCLLCLYCETDQ